jgi:uncharacterized RDD family membrane protein YckC
VEFEDRLATATPEGIELELMLAGLGSRATAGLVDLVLKALLAGAVLLAAALALGDLGLAVVVPSIGLVLFLYDVLFEVLGDGRTPGKRLNALRVVRSSGRPVDLRASAVRNALRLVDGIAFSYLPTIVCVLATRRNQRPGDLAADTLVVRDVRAVQASPRALAPPPGAGEIVLDVTGVGREELAAVRSFLARRDELDSSVRVRLASQLAAALRPRVGGATTGLPNERLLEHVAAAKAAAADVTPGRTP